MVGVPRSAGCLACVKRRVKCDQARPGCGNCARLARSRSKQGNDDTDTIITCPGYDRGFKFVAGKHQVRSRGGAGRGGGGGGGGRDGRDGDGESDGDGDGWPVETLSNLELIPRPPRSGQGRSQVRDLNRAGNRAVGELQLRRASQEQGQGQGQHQGQNILQMCPTPTPNRAQLIGNTIQALYGAQQGGEIMLFAPWFNSVPQKLGNKPSLDYAMAAFTIHLLGKAEGSAHLIAESLSLYGQSLAALQRALKHPVEWKAPETLCATMLLTFYEAFAGTSDGNERAVNPSSWMKHAKGVSMLIQQRGVDAYRDPWDRSMLLSFRTFIIMHCMFSDEDCFLAKKKWQNVIAAMQPAQDTSAMSATAVIAATHVDAYFNHLAKVPGLLHHGMALREATARGLPIDTSRIVLLVKSTAQLHSELGAWLDGFMKFTPSPVERPSRDPDSIFDSALHYESPWYGAVYMSYWATMLILQEILNLCHYPVSYAASNRQLADNIFRSIETVHPGYMGPYRVGYPVRIAYEFADVSTQVWLAAVLAKTEKHYAATSPTGYPEPGTTSPMSA
ncbi:hypothetical protein B0T26DRAFT_674516 [Lasiosphaeria miniovina]|uniref:Zn(2)-C6 fungal-type domain-containing protein n=1 Tax=Lasiosphaeria miniovina TaxID=1954250 RepID=A0AA40E0V8_9PEZI|nr:uncharacterized protein B0T26DRAFT_674516 [Lasiosphaeria miniovina]KAK0722870.1 hypothetical protein B0T26DRAFT_674516 [Lasiosphaeria miniovina]